MFGAYFKGIRMVQLLRWTTLAVIVRCSFLPALAADPPTAFECRWTDTPLTIDGKADEEAWKRAQVIDYFYQPWLGKDARPAKSATKARLLWDREYIYFFADMEDNDLFADVKEQNGKTWHNDVFELFFKPAADKTGYFEFQVNALGTLYDSFIPAPGAPQQFDNFQYEAKVVRRGTLNEHQDKDEGWSAEGRIPWRDFARGGGRPAVDEKWKFTLCRFDYNIKWEAPDLSTCAPLTQRNFHQTSAYATLRFVGPKAKGSAKPYGIERRVALTTSKLTGSPEPPPPFRIVRAYPDLNLTYPIMVAHQPGSDRILLVTQIWSSGPGRLMRMKDEPGAREVETLLEIEDMPYSIAFHPQFAKNGYLYLSSSNYPVKDAKSKVTRVVRYTIDPKPPYALDRKSARLILEWDSNGHNGGAMGFGHDGMFYLTTGDGTSDSDTNIAGQDMTKLLSKVLRLDLDHPDAGKEYSVPRDNPFVGQKDIRLETWAYGFRNPWRLTVDEKTGHIWVGQNGQDLWEQAYLVRKGENYGWSVYEGSYPFYLNRKLGPTPHVKPTIEHPHSEFRSLTGGIVYYGKKFPELQGAYIYGDYSTGAIWGMRHDGNKVLWHKQLADTRLAITSFGTDSHGEILITDHRGKGKGALFTFEATPKDLPPSTFPRKLSESGLFRSVKDHVMEPALIPYSVNAPLWSDGAHKERWIALPGADSRIDFKPGKAWEFPDQTVLVKSFALEMEEGNPASRRWLETRFLTNQNGEWYGYSYRWNDEQTDGFLVQAKGEEQEFTIATGKGVRKQTWHYPSRTECMVCHSRAADYVLGLNELQMNKEHDYGGVRDNQLRTLEYIGVFRVEPPTNGKHAKGQRDAVPSTLLSQPPEKHDRLVDPYDASADLTARARSYLHANCAQCHVEAGGGNSAMELGFTTKLDKTRLIDVKPLHHTFDLPDARLVAPGSPERSVLLHRMTHRGPGHMPPLATSRVDEEAVRMMGEWIRSMPTVVKQ